MVLEAAGFGAGGVAAGSLAAKVQAAFYAGGTTGIFSTLQSAGAAGIGTSANIVIAGVGKYVGSYFCDLDIPSESSTSAESSAAGLASEIFSTIGGMGGGTFFRNSDIKSECLARDSKSKVPVIFCSEDGQCLICK